MGPMCRHPAPVMPDRALCARMMMMMMMGLRIAGALFRADVPSRCFHGGGDQTSPSWDQSCGMCGHLAALLTASAWAMIPAPAIGQRFVSFDRKLD